ncbi:tetratricopeptide repeat protein [Sphingomonas faeni]|uniref:tetratricopeptide repeat protein n=1 Tax=Sphingomonas faeni TaxID=185950 RepID=UPI002780DA94|nr:tetratricopeptide repeat protein [Sphingomonas faeni]MDQ0837949.1 tetratricopeptide (TPR) repeat protein [Sphingomonas faeni]
MLAASHADPVVAIRAYRKALEAGDMPLATRAAAILNRAGVAPADAALLPLADAARRNDAKAASAAIATLSTGPLVVLAPSLYAWVAHAEGRDPEPSLATAARDPVANRFATETRTLIAATPRKQPLAIGVSRLLARLAGDLSAGEPSPLSIALTQAALRADPSFDAARVLLADALARNTIVDRALAVLDEIDPKSPSASAAAAERIDILSNADRDGEALAAAKNRVDQRDAGPADWQRYADLLLTTGNPAEAATWYQRIIAADDAKGGNWGNWLQYGGALDQAGRWPEARDALEKAVARGPAQPLALNYLGFAQVEHGDDIPASIRLLERASRLDPTNPSITDSLGWAYHLSGDTARALPLLERAAQGEPANTEIGDHLGDAYWSIGRNYEARYAWRAALLTAEPTEIARITAKIANGLPPKARR